MTELNQEIKFLLAAIQEHTLMVQKLKKQNVKNSTLLRYYENSIIEKRDRIEEIEKGG